ncbi:hypothetical protein MAPG_07218 [Magnaporthiopsis poae ATCC 64411]|uniref:Uncharacterized protein n=1 Tax=Magnaporthiopsis poae (strain ATCC 64411 / 73-15) TaxID=644358 RepID=A0A0C4E430_MAGP6|nr:hypothetical protein MAPG_07218 [Magnaporthiopsis poae ATCC 64411]
MSTRGSDDPEMVLSGAGTSTTQSWTLNAYIYDTNGPTDRFVQPYPEPQAERLARLQRETEALLRRANPSRGARQTTQHTDANKRTKSEDKPVQ